MENQRLTELMIQSQTGQQRAYAELLHACERIIRSSVRRRIHRSEIVEEITQEVLISIDRAKHTYDPSRPFRPWLNALIEYRLADHWRKFGRVTEYELQTENSIEDAVDESTIELRESFNVDAALERLPAQQREALLLTKKEGLSVRETATKMNLSESAVKMNVHRALKSMRKLILGKEFDENE